MVVTYLIVVLMVLFNSPMVLSDSSFEKNAECDTFFDETLNGKLCCKSEIFSEDRLDTSECNVYLDKNMTCEHNKCVLKLENVLTDDEIDYDKVNKLFDQWEKDYPKEKPMVIRARKECLDGEYREYFSKHNCIESKLYFCVYINAIVDCQSWSENAECAEVKEHAQKCKDAQDMK